MTERVTYVEAAEILGCHVSYVPKLVRQGKLRSETRRRGAFLREDVEELAMLRAAKAAAPKPRRPHRVDHRPDHQHHWLSLRQVADLVGLTSQAIGKRVRRGTLPGVENEGRVWVRADHLELVERARLVQRTRRP